MRPTLASVRANTEPGVHCTLADLLALRAAAQGLGLEPPRRSAGDPGGAAPSRLRGRGIEFEEVRGYAAGDDVRSIDWRVTARTGRAHTRVFRADRERPVYLLLDQRAPMFFGSRKTLKSVQALHVLALLAWAALDGGDCVGGLVLADGEHHERRPRRSRRAVLELLRLALDFNQRLGIPPAAPRETPSLADALDSLRRVARPGSLAVLISDFADWSEPAARQFHLLARHVEVHGIGVYDPLERRLPALGIARVSDGARELELDTAGAGLRERFAARGAAQQAELATAFRRMGAPLHELATDARASATLARWYRAR